jgi:thiol-disulfide isomerase/thioredoxin
MPGTINSLALVLALVATTSGREPGRGEPPANPGGKKPASVREQYQALLDALQEARADLAKSLSEARGHSQREAIRAKETQLYRKFAPRFLELAERNPKEGFAMQGLVIVMANVPDGPETEQAVKLTIRDHLGDPKLGANCQLLSLRGTPAAEKLAKAVLASSSDHKLQSDAILALAQFYKAKSEAEDVAPVEAEKYGKAAEEQYERLLNTYADVKGISEQAKPELFELRHLGLGKEAPNIFGNDSAGKKFTLADYRGKVVLLDFWADWCAACMALVPEERALLKRMQGKPFALVGVNLDPSVEVMQKCEQKHHLTWPSFFDGAEGPIVKTWNIRVMPTIIVLDENGVIRYKGQQMEDADKAAQALVKALEAKK